MELFVQSAQLKPEAVVQSVFNPVQIFMEDAVTGFVSTPKGKIPAELVVKMGVVFSLR